jgi:hypothetical protein
MKKGLIHHLSSALKSMDEAINKFFPNHKQWDLKTF